MLHQIGVGALGPVFRTYEPVRDRLVAVKVFRLDVTPEQAGALAEELGRATEAGLFHPSIVEPVAAGLEGTVAYRAEEYVAAESLDVAMRHYAPATLDKALPFITQLASAIDIARAAGVGHGALHPRDIFVTPDEARATGFGVVDALERLGLRAPVRRPYSPPERIAGQAWSTPADVFSLGAIAFELLTGRRPSGLGDQMGSLSGAALGSHADSIRAVLAKAMSEDPGARYPTATAFASALASAADQAVASSPIAAVAAVPPPPPPVVEAPAEALDETALTVSETESLEIFAAEPESPVVDSPREAARRAIAARKRQPKPKPPQEPTAAAPLEPLPLAPPAPADPVDAAAADALEIEEPEVAAAAADTAAVATESLEPVELVSPLAEAQAADMKTAERDKSQEKNKDSAAGYSVASLADVDLWHLDPVHGKEPELERADVESAQPALAVTLPGDEDEVPVDAPLVAETSDRVITVDEFRARDTSGPRGEKSTERSSERSGERAWPRPSGRPMPSIAPVSRGVPPPTKLLETNDVPLVPEHEEAEHEPEPQRTAMLQNAIILILGLLLGYGGGYVVAQREAQNEIARLSAAATSVTTVPPISTPGTSGQSRPYSEQAVSPAAGQNPSAPPTPVDGAARVPPASSSAVTPPPPRDPAPKPAPTPSKAAAAPPKTTAAPPKPTPAPPKTTPTPPAPKPAPPAAAAAPAPTGTGTIVVKSVPPKAAVTVNGRWTGRTPLTLDRRGFGEYVIRVVEPGYDVAREVFTLSAKTPSKMIDVQLTPNAGPRAPQGPAEKPGATATGGIFVDSRPQGARVLINGKAVGVTPLRLNDQPAGSYEVRLELAEHQPWTVTARVVAGEIARVTGSMERIR